MSWLMCIRLVLSRRLLQGSSSSCPRFIYSVLFLILLRRPQSWSDIVLCYRVSPQFANQTLQLCSHSLIQQRGPHLPPSGPHLPHLQIIRGDLKILRLRTSIQRYADARIHALPACPTHHCRKACHALDPGSFPSLQMTDVLIYLWIGIALGPTEPQTGTRRPRISRCERNDGHPSQLPDPL